MKEKYKIYLPKDLYFYHYLNMIIVLANDNGTSITNVTITSTKNTPNYLLGFLADFIV